jgi:alkylation response protein AidB-like acyl-CoA dehydrogenase
MEFAWAESQIAYRQKLVDLKEREIPSDWWENYAAHGPANPKLMQFARSFNPKLAAEDLVVPHWPVEYGGRNADAWDHIIMSEEMWSDGEPRSSLYMGTNWAGPAIMRFGTEAQKRDHLLPLAQGKVLWCQGFSEPSAGTDLAALSTRAERTATGYRLNGSKIWTSYAANADICFLLAKMDDAGKSKGAVTVFLVPLWDETGKARPPGLEIRPILGIHHDDDFNEVFLTDLELPENARLGGEGMGWEIVQAVIHNERIGAARYEHARRALNNAVAHLKQRGKFKGAIRQAAARAFAACEAARWLTYLVIDGRVKGRGADNTTYIARYAMILCNHAVSNFISENMPDLLIDGVDGRSLQFWSSAISSGMAAGAAEVQLNMISGRHLGLPRGV